MENNQREETVNAFIRKHRFYFPEKSLDDVRKTLMDADDRMFRKIISGSYKNPDVMFWMAFPLGMLGMDRFVLGEVGLGIVKLITLGNFGIGFLVDTFTIHTRTREYNYEEYLSMKFNQLQV